MIKPKTKEETIENTLSNVQATLAQFDKHMPYNGDYNLSILKGHLLVQERLWNILKRRLPNHDVLADKKIQLEFYTLIDKLCPFASHRCSFKICAVDA